MHKPYVPYINTENGGIKSICMYVYGLCIWIIEWINTDVRGINLTTGNLLPGDASVDSWFREIRVPRAWRVYFQEKNRACFGSIGVPTLASVSYLVTIL